MANELVAVEAARLPDTSRVDARASEALVFAREVAVTDDRSYSIVGEFLVGLKDLRREIESTFDPVVKASHGAWRAALAARAKHLAPVEEAEKICSEKLGVYKLEAERRAREEEERQRQEALKKIEAARLEQAAVLEQEGRQDEAAALIEAPISVPPVSVRGAPEVVGLTTRRRWAYRITNERLIPREYLRPDEAKIRGVVARLGPDAKIPGVEVFEVTDFARNRSGGGP